MPVPSPSPAVLKEMGTASVAEAAALLAAGPHGSLLAAKRIDVQSLIHARYPIEQGVQAFEHAQRAGVLKVLIKVYTWTMGFQEIENQDCHNARMRNDTRK